MTAIGTTTAAGAPRLPGWVRYEVTAFAVVTALGLIGYLVFPFDLALLTRIIAVTFLVLSLDLVTGYAGVVTLGQAAIFGVAAYAVGNACLAGITDPVMLLGVGIIAGALMGLVSGVLISRFSALPQLVISIAFGQLVAALANKLAQFTGGSDGLAGFAPSAVLGVFEFDIFGRTSFGFSLVVLAVVLALLLRFVQSPFGLMCRGIRDDALRARMIGTAVYPRLIVMYGVSGAVAGVGGALSAINVGVVSLHSVSFEMSAEALVMLVVGGAGHLLGAVFGSILFQIFGHFVGSTNPFHWMTIVGGTLILITLFAPKGLYSAFASAMAKFRKSRVSQ
ncbi:branched-chain amino acid ABC transporter permease [Mesorhizobium xinjiangense]|uniref:branched-chain amino acid ABC transporter permease n=1 Tax=Mesorhizobium xinjiangense TaxID=2678685 RepID=UPI0012ED4040|nr:branched-chain amino acid ABC transporter permease [Mesorhizobium xinjiangense]